MRRLLAVFMFSGWLILGSVALAQRPADAPPIVEAKKEVIVNWTLDNKVWIFKDIATAYEPVKGEYDPLKNEAVWTLRLVRDFQPGEAIRHTETERTPFQPVILDADKIVIAEDLPVKITPVTGKVGDSILMVVRMPEPDILKDVKTIRVQRRSTNV